jgi:hypothetical protein
MIAIVLAALGVIVPSFIVTLAIRRWIEPVSWRMAGLCLAIALAVVGRSVFTTGMPVPLDEVVRGYPYRGIFGEVVAQNYLTNDTVKQILPWMHTVREQMFSGQVPLWNPHLFSGYPLLGNGQSAPFSPVFLATLFVPLPKQIVAMAGVKLFLALLFGFLLVRREGVSDAAAMFASVVFALAIFNNVFLYYPMTAVTLLLPAAAYGVLWALRERRAAPMVFVAIVVASLLAGGHPESVVHVTVAVLVLVGIEWIAPRWAAERFSWRDLLRVTVAALLGLALAAPAWVPVVEQALVSVRVDSLRSAAAAPTFPATAIWAMLNPDGFGNPARQNWSWIFAYTHVASLYLGLIATALIPAAIFARRHATRERLLIASAFVFFLAAMKWGFVAEIFYAAPPLSWVAHDRFRFVICLFVAMAAAHALNRFGRAEAFVTAVTGTALGGLAVYVLTVMHRRNLFSPELAIGVIVLIVFIVASFIVRSRVATMAAVLTALELFTFNYVYNAVVDGRYYAPRLPIIEALRDHSKNFQEPFRVLGFDWVFLPNAAAQYGLEDIRGSDPMAWGPYGEFLRTAAVQDQWIEDVKRIADAEHPIVDFLNVRYLLTEPGMDPGPTWERIYDGRDGELYLNREYRSRFFPMGEAAAEVAVRQWSPTRLHLSIRARERALIGSSQPAMRWWYVEQGGERLPIERISGVFTGFWVEAGSSKVEVYYRPWTFWIAAVISVLAMTGIGFWGRWLSPVRTRNS